MGKVGSCWEKEDCDKMRTPLVLKTVDGGNSSYLVALALLSPGKGKP